CARRVGIEVVFTAMPEWRFDVW
nr:immunoglobulin heavy chain junction region [Macaca mulatta]MOV52856.1 immunoglobulin heavy chain junction region [Macaca mulatta]